MSKKTRQKPEKPIPPDQDIPPQDDEKEILLITPEMFWDLLMEQQEQM